MKSVSAFLIAAILISAALLAAEDETTAGNNETENAQNDQPVQDAEVLIFDPDGEPDFSIILDDENFVPTVQIAEDLPVAFPVDI